MQRFLRIGLLALAVFVSGQASSQESEGRRQAPPQADAAKLPAQSVTSHTLTLADRTLRFTATAGALTLIDPQGAPQAEYAYTAYTLDGAEPGSRPIAFVVNGGPGASSAYLHFLALGPWRLGSEGPAVIPSSSPELVANSETWLDFTDLVFIDPPGTGYSRVIGGDQVRERFYSVDGDIDGLAAFVMRWLKEKGRLGSPKFFIGESYGGFRGPLLAEKLQTDQGVGLSGLILVSPVLDFSWFEQAAHTPWSYVMRLPSMAAAAMEEKGQNLTRDSLLETESYATGPYLDDLLRGPRNEEAVARISERLASLTGLDTTLIKRLSGRVSTLAFQRETLRDKGEIVSAYDGTTSGYDPSPSAYRTEFEDPGLTAITAPLTSAAIGYTSSTLNYRPEGRYNLLNGAVNSAWRWSRGRGRPENVTAMRQILALDPNLRILVAHGFTDLVTPYFASQLILEQLPAYGPQPRVSLSVYGGGHMFYMRTPSRQAFRADSLKVFQDALASRSPTARE